MSRRLLSLTVVTFALWLWAAPAPAQTRSALVGTAMDESGGVLPGVTVTIEGPRLLGGPRTFITQADGSYRFADLLPGEYQVTGTLEGFQTVKRAGIQLLFGTTLTVDLKMAVGGLSETVTVVGTSPTVDVTVSASTLKLEAVLLQDLPNVNRRLGFEVIHQAPGVADRSAYGGARDANSLLVDGMAVTMPQRAGIDAASMISINWMEEVQVVGLGANAEYGDFSGIASNMVMRSGSNRLSGLFEAVTNRPNWSGSNTGSLPESQRESFRPRYLLSQNFDAQVGGPIVKDKVFFFVGGQGFRERQRIAGALGDVPRIETRGRGIGKVNWAPSDAVKLEGVYTYDRTMVTGQGAGVSTRPEATSEFDTPKMLWNARLTWVKGAHTYIEVRNGGLDYRQWNDPTPPATRGGPASVVDRFTGIRSENTSSFRTQTGVRSQTAATVTHYKDGFLGRSHQLKVGVEYEYSQFRQEQGYPAQANYTYFQGVPEQMVTWEGDTTEATGHRVTLFAQDGWALTNRITLQPGVRVAFNRGSVPARGRIFSTNPVSPRMGVAWDLQGDHKTVLRGHWGRFHDGFFTAYYEFMHFSGLNPRITYRMTDGEWVEANRSTAPQNFAIDPDITHSYMDQYTLAIERELLPNFSLTAQYIRRNFENTMAFIDTKSNYAPTQMRDVGPDGVASTADDGEMVTVYTLLNRGESFLLLTNPEEAYRKYDGLQLIAKKRFANNWQLLASYTRQRTRGNVDNTQAANTAGGDAGQTGVFVNPNRMINADQVASLDRPHEVRVQGSYRITRLGGVMAGLNYTFRSGTPWGRTAVFRLSQGNQTIQIEPRDANRNDPVNRLDLRFEKKIPLGGHRDVGIYLDVFNLANQGVGEVRNASGANFGTIGSWSSPRQLEVAVRYGF
ncbi:MAG TPA: TonB-dependent receptor [Vicinamibacterales bacterium]|nr:TonB-dependent receptor [Vicinamibacterales bacterium]